MEPTYGQMTVTEWLGLPVLVKYMAGPDYELDPENISRIVTGQAEARAGWFVLTKLGTFGIEVKRLNEDDIHFIPWGSVLSMQPLPKEVREPLMQAMREAMQQEQTEETTPSPDRQELMDMLANVGTPSEAADAKAAADGWLLAHPSDGDVRMAREQLEDRFPDDAESEGSQAT